MWCCVAACIAAVANYASFHVSRSGDPDNVVGPADTGALETGSDSTGAQLYSTPNTHMDSTYKPKLTMYFKVLTVTDQVNQAASCGGCVALFSLATHLRENGQNVETFNQQLAIDRGWDCDIRHSLTVVIYSEGLIGTCKSPFPTIHVRWILSPMGTNFPASWTEHWNQDDWVYNYCTNAMGLPMPYSTSYRSISPLIYKFQLTECTLI